MIKYLVSLISSEKEPTTPNKEWVWIDKTGQTGRGAPRFSDYNTLFPYVLQLLYWGI